MEVRRLLLFALIILIPIALFIYFFQNYQYKQVQQREAEPLPYLLIDTTDDLKALGYSGQKKLAADDQANIYLAYRKKYNDYYEIFVARISGSNSNNISGISQPISPVSNRVNQRVPSIVIDNKNVIHIAWYGADSSENEGDRQIKYSNSTDGGNTWSRWKNISYVDGYDDQNLWQEHPDIITTNDGKIVVVWEGKDSEFSSQQIKLSVSRDNGQSWAPWKNIAPVSNASQSRPTIIKDQSGLLHLFMYSTMGGDAQQIWHSLSTDGENWSQWENISKNAVDSRHVSAASDGNGRVMAVWRSGTDKGSGIYYTVFDNNSWSGPRLFSESSNYHFFPTVGVDSANNFYVSWIESKNRSDFPNDDPTKGQVMVRSYSYDNKKFTEIKVVSNDSNALYPNALTNSAYNSGILLSFLSGNKDYRIYLTNIEASEL